MIGKFTVFLLAVLIYQQYITFMRITIVGSRKVMELLQ